MLVKNTNYNIKEKNLFKIIDRKNFVVANYGRFNCYSVKSKYLMKKLGEN